MSKRIIGVDAHQVKDSFDHILATAVRADPDLLVVVPRVLNEQNMKDIAYAHMAGVSVHIERDSALAPDGTRWLAHPVL